MLSDSVSASRVFCFTNVALKPIGAHIAPLQQMDTTLSFRGAVSKRVRSRLRPSAAHRIAHDVQASGRGSHGTIQLHAPLATTAALCVTAALARVPPALARSVATPAPVTDNGGGDASAMSAAEAQALQIWEAAWRQLMDADAAQSAEAAGALVLASMHACDLGRYDDGLRGFEQALRVLSSTDKRESEQVAYIYECRAMALVRVEKLSEALASHRRGFEMRKAMGHKTDAAMKGCMQSAIGLASLQHWSGDVQAAAETMREALALGGGKGTASKEAIKKGREVLAIMDAEVQKSQSYIASGDGASSSAGSDELAEAAQGLEDVKMDPEAVQRGVEQLQQDIARAVSGDKSEQQEKVLKKLWDRATIMAHFAARAEGLAAMRALMPLEKALHGQGSVAMAERAMRVATVLTLDGQHNEASRLWRGALRDYTKQLGAESYEVQICRCGYGKALMIAQRRNEGVAEIKAALPALAAVRGEDDDTVLECRAILAQEATRRKRSAEPRQPPSDEE